MCKVALPIRRRRCLRLLACLAAVGCGQPDVETQRNFADRQSLLDPQACRACHPGQYEEWAGSMHAYASRDPVFVAMNARGQQETEGRLGTFCVNCHAPMAVREQMTDDGLNLSELPEYYQGVTCYFCHNTERVEGVHNNPLLLADDVTMRGPFLDPADNPMHASAYSPHFDSERPESSAFCGACHDVTLTESLVGDDIHLERTYAEWQESLFARPASEGGVGCNGCHMPYSPTRRFGAESAGAPERRSARHDFEGIDLALDAFPGRERQRLLVERLLASSLLAEICVAETGAIEVTVENAGAGHHWPSGASHDREAWLDLQAFDAEGAEPVYRTVAPESDEEQADREVLKDHVVDAEGQPAHMFWDVRSVASSTTLPSVATRDPLDPEFHRERRTWTFNAGRPTLQRLDRVTLTVRIRPVALAILDDLTASGHLDADAARAMPVLAVLPDRCYDSEIVERHADILTPDRADCEDPERGEYTLVWQSAEAVPDNPVFRAARVDGVPARCVSHPSYTSAFPVSRDAP